jgi:hypothetical protein
MRKQKIYSSNGSWGEKSVLAPIQECFTEYSKLKPTSMHKIWSSTTDNPFHSDKFRNECEDAANKYESTMLGGRKPSSVAAAIVYGVGRRYNLGVKQFWVSKYFKVTEVSLRNNLNYLYKQGIVE